MLMPVLKTHLDLCHANCMVDYYEVNDNETIVARARINHGQTLQRLAERGGLSPGELFCLIHDLPWSAIRKSCHKVAIERFEYETLRKPIPRNA